VQEEDRKQRALPGTAQRNGPVVLDHLERPQDAELEHRRVLSRPIYAARATLSNLSNRFATDDRDGRGDQIA
jgi:hypothetical protein